MVPTIDAFRCDGCGICVQRCPPQIMGLVKGIAVIITDLCEECGICRDVCPIDAVHFKLPHRSFKSPFTPDLKKLDPYRPLPR